MVEPRGLEVADDWRTLQSPETYLGHAQSTGFASEISATRPGASPFLAPTRPAAGSFRDRRLVLVGG